MSTVSIGEVRWLSQMLSNRPARLRIEEDKGVDETTRRMKRFTLTFLKLSDNAADKAQTIPIARFIPRLILEYEC